MNITHTLAISSIVLVFGSPVSRVLATNAQAGKAVYDKSCAGCHGADGKGNPAMAKVLGDKGLNILSKDTTQQSDEQLLKVIAEGAGKMPASAKLSKAEQKQVLDYTDLWRSNSQGPRWETDSAPCRAFCADASFYHHSPRAETRLLRKRAKKLL